MFTSVSSIPVEWEWKRINRKLKSSFLIYLNSVTCTSYTYNQRYLCCPLCYYHYLCHGRLPVLVFLLLHCYNQFVLEDVPLQNQITVSYFFYVYQFPLSQVYTLRKRTGKEKGVCLCIMDVCVYVCIRPWMARCLDTVSHLAMTHHSWPAGLDVAPSPILPLHSCLFSFREPCSLPPVPPLEQNLVHLSSRYTSDSQC